MNRENLIENVDQFGEKVGRLGSITSQAGSGFLGLAEEYSMECKF